MPSWRLNDVPVSARHSKSTVPPRYEAPLRHPRAGGLYFTMLLLLYHYASRADRHVLCHALPLLLSLLIPLPLPLPLAPTLPLPLPRTLSRSGPANLVTHTLDPRNRQGAMSPLHLPYISPISPYVSPISPYISPISSEPSRRSPQPTAHNPQPTTPNP